MEPQLSKYQMNLALPEKLVERLDDLAEAMDVTRSEVARLILAQYLCGKLELRIEDQNAVEALATMIGRWPSPAAKTKRTTSRKRRS